MSKVLKFLFIEVLGNFFGGLLFLLVSYWMFVPLLEDGFGLESIILVIFISLFLFGVYWCFSEFWKKKKYCVFLLGYEKCDGEIKKIEEYKIPELSEQEAKENYFCTVVVETTAHGILSKAELNLAMDSKNKHILDKLKEAKIIVYRSKLDPKLALFFIEGFEKYIVR